MNLLIPVLLTLIAGVGVAVQAPTNAALARTSGSTILAALISFAVGTLVLAAVWLAVDRTAPTAARGVPAWAWLGGLYGATFVTAAAYAAPRLGVASMLMIAIASQLAMAVAIDHFGLFGVRAEPISAARVLGLMLVIGGVILVRR